MSGRGNAGLFLSVLCIFSPGTSFQVLCPQDLTKMIPTDGGECWPFFIRHFRLSKPETPKKRQFRGPGGTILEQFCYPDAPYGIHVTQEWPKVGKRVDFGDRLGSNGTTLAAQNHRSTSTNAVRSHLGSRLEE